MAKGKKTGGRTKGTPNKVTADVKVYAQEHCARAIEALASIAFDTEQPTQARVAACREILDRGYGKASQALDVTTREMRPLVIDRVSTRKEMLEALGEPDDEAGED